MLPFVHPESPQSAAWVPVHLVYFARQIESAPDGGPGRLSHGVLLAIGAPLVAFSPPIGVQAVIIIGHTLFGVGFAWSGYALFTARKNPPAEPHPAAR